MSTPSTPAKIAILSGLWNRGYHVVRCFMTAEEVAMALAGVDAVPESKWFKSTATETRRQAVLNLPDNINASPPIYRLAYERLVNFASRPHHSWTIVEVQKGCPPEELHRDFQPAETTGAIKGHEWVQSSVLVALHEGMNHSRAFMDPMKNQQIASDRSWIHLKPRGYNSPTQR